MKSNSQKRYSKIVYPNQKLLFKSNRLNPTLQLSKASPRRILSKSSSKQRLKNIEKNLSYNDFKQINDINDNNDYQTVKIIDNFNDQSINATNNDAANTSHLLNDESIQEVDTEENANSVDIDGIDYNEQGSQKETQAFCIANNSVNGTEIQTSTNKATLNCGNDNILRQFLQNARKGDKELFLEVLDKIMALGEKYVNFQDEQGQSALHYAADEGNLKIVEILIKSNADLNLRSNIKRTPLHISCSHGYFDITKLLIENGALINIQDNERNTPIHLCVMGGHIELLKYLLDKFPQADGKNIYGKTPIDIANSEEVKNILREYLNKNESKYHKIKIHNVNSTTAISMLNCINKHSSGNSNLSLNSNPNIKGVLFPHNQKSKKLHTHVNSSLHNSSQKNKKYRPDLSSAASSNHSGFSNGNNNNININISANMCNVLNLSEQKSKKILNTHSSTGFKSQNHSHNHHSNSNNNTKASISIEAKIASPKMKKKSVSKQFFHSKNFASNKLMDLKQAGNTSGVNNSHNLGTINHLVSPEKSVKKINLTSKMNSVFAKAKSKPNFFSNESKKKFSQGTKKKPSSTQSNKLTLNLSNTNQIFRRDKSNPKKHDTGPTKKIANVEINLNDLSSTSNNSQSNLNYTNIDNNQDNINNISLSRSQDIGSEERITPELFTCHALLGRGSFGSVYLVEKKNTQMFYAMKVLNKSLIMNQNIVKYAMTERNVLSITSHPFIVKLNYAFQTIDKLFLILDYCPGGDLAEHLAREKRFKESRAKIYLCEIILALGDLHKHDIIFRDLKPDNVVLDSLGHAMLTDFGLSKEGIFDGNITKSFCGSIAYLAPEMLKRKGHGKAVDWYLLGVLFYEMLVGIPPYFTENQEMIFKNIEKGDLTIPNFVSERAKVLLRALLKKDPAQRLGYNNDVEEIKAHEYFRGINWDDVYKRKMKPPVPKTESGLKKRKGVEIEKVLEEEDQAASSTGEVDETQQRNLFNGWTFIQNDTDNLQTQAQTQTQTQTLSKTLHNNK